MRPFLAFLCASALLSSCQKESDAVAPAVFTQQVMGQTWLESTEEEQPGSGVELYRKDTSPFPASRPRNGFRFDADGVFTGRGPAATDGIAVFPGRWLMEGNNTLRIIPADKSSSYGLQIISLDKNLLQVRRLQ